MAGRGGGGGNLEADFPVLGLHGLLLLIQHVLGGLSIAARLACLSVLCIKVHQALYAKLGHKDDQPVGPDLHIASEIT